ncbi:MAG: HAMP domain-containing protein, partial [Geodermatophilaceae bacterium]|nr:HAMP domain-containing protein [Geodermatophilaceae bacterium]
MRFASSWGLRGRLIFLGTAGLAVGLAIGGILLVAVLRSTLEGAVDDAAGQTALEVAALIDAGRLPDPIPSGGTTIVQVVDDAGQVRAASAGGDRLVASVPPGTLTAGPGRLGYLSGYRFGVSEVVRVVTVLAGPAGDRQTVVVAVPAGEIEESVRVVAGGLLVGYAILLTAAVALAWRLVSATLRPVTALREGAEEITGTGSRATLPVPAVRDEIHELAVTLNGMLARLDAARGRQRAFVADAAHELRSPLTSLRTQLEVAAAVERRDVAD